MSNLFNRPGIYIEVIVRDDNNAKIERRVYKQQDRNSVYLMFRWLNEKYGLGMEQLREWLIHKTSPSSQRGFLDF